jgi:hypothetical protein
MEKILAASILFVAMLFDYGYPLKLYSRALQEKRIADSLHRVDSVRVARRAADSSRVADSLTVVRYGESDSILALEKRNEAKEATETQFIPQTGDAGVIQISAPIDNISGRTIEIDPGNPYAKTIDSLQKVIDRLNSSVHDNDSRFKEMKNFPISEKKRYMLFLLQNKMKDTASILACCNGLAEVYKVKYELLVAIKNSQDAKTKSFIQYHIDEHKKKMAELSNFMLAMTPKLPFYPQREIHKLTTEQ